MTYVEENLTKELSTHSSLKQDVGNGNNYINSKENELDNRSSSEETTNNGNFNLIVPIIQQVIYQITSFRFCTW